MKHPKLYDVVQDFWDAEWANSYYVSRDNSGVQAINLLLLLLRLASEEKHLWSSK